MLKMHDSLSPLVKAIMACFSLKGSMTSKEKDNLGFKWLRGIKVYIYFFGVFVTPYVKIHFKN
jgi:hypothetical protein